MGRCYSCASAVSAHKQMDIGDSGSARRQSLQFCRALGGARARLIRRVAGFVRFEQVYRRRAVSPYSLYRINIPFEKSRRILNYYADPRAASKSAYSRCSSASRSSSARHRAFAAANRAGSVRDSVRYNRR